MLNQNKYMEWNERSEQKLSCVVVLILLGTHNDTVQQQTSMLGFYEAANARRLHTRAHHIDHVCFAGYLVTRRRCAGIIQQDTDDLSSNCEPVLVFFSLFGEWIVSIDVPSHTQNLNADLCWEAVTGCGRYQRTEWLKALWRWRRRWGNGEKN